MEETKVEDDRCQERPWMAEENAREYGCPNANLPGERESLEETKEEDEKKKKYVTSETLPASVANQASENSKPFCTSYDQARNRQREMTLSLTELGGKVKDNRQERLFAQM